MIKIYDEELSQIRLRDLSGDGVAVEIVGKGDLMQITEGWIHFGTPICNYQLSEYTSLKHSEARESSLLKQIESLEKEVAALKSQPGWELDVSPIAMLKAFRSAPRGELHKNIDDVESMKAVLDLCRSSIRPAVTYGGWHFEDGKIVPNRMPEGVPSVEELAWIGSVAYANHKSESGIPEAHAAAAAIRDRVLAGVQAKGGGWELDVTWEEMSDMWPDHDSIESGMTAILDLCRSRIRPAAPRAYTDADVEALARALHEAEPHMPPATYKERNEAMARAAMDWMGATVGECKECEKLKEQRKALRKIVIDSAEEVRARIDASRAALEGE